MEQTTQQTAQQTPQQPAQQTQQTQVQPPWATAKDGQWVIGDKPWYDTVPEQPVKEWAAKKQYANPHQALMAAMNAEKALSGAGDVIILPSGTDDEKAWNTFYDKKGRPKDANEYKFEGEETFDKSMLEFSKPFFHRLGLNKFEAAKAVKEWNEFIPKYNQQMEQAQEAQQKQQNQEAIAGIQKQWGDKMQTNLAAGQRALQALKLSPATLQSIEKHIGVAAVVETLVQLGSMTKEGSLLGGGSGGDPNNVSGLSPDQLDAKISEFRTKYQAALTDPYHGEHQIRMQELERIYAVSSTQGQNK
jgi:hypothetical protein